MRIYLPYTTALLQWFLFFFFFQKKRSLSLPLPPVRQSGWFPFLRPLIRHVKKVWPLREKRVTPQGFKTAYMHTRICIYIILTAATTRKEIITWAYSAVNGEERFKKKRGKYHSCSYVREYTYVYESVFTPPRIHSCHFHECSLHAYTSAAQGGKAASSATEARQTRKACHANRSGNKFKSAHREWRVHENVIQANGEQVNNLAAQPLNSLAA